MLYNLFVYVLNFLPKKIAHKLLYFKFFHKYLDLKHPLGLNEKIHYLIINDHSITETRLTDKILVKDFINELAIDKLYIPKTFLTLDINDNITSELFDSLPQKFVMKCNHGSGKVYIYDKSIDKDLIDKINDLKKDLKIDYSREYLEYHYSGIEPKILFEEYLDDDVNSRPSDYKFFCYKGYVKCVMVCTDRGVYNYKDFYDVEWNHLDYGKQKYCNPKKIEKPQNFKRMIDIASKLSSEFKFVRVDLYNINGKIYFSELTFTPAAGLSRTYSDYGNVELGKDLKL